MEIKTKYNIGDKVWVASAYDEPTEFSIVEIEVSVYKNFKPDIQYRNANDEGHFEERLYPTKEELLKSLQQ